jgi:two-component system response regulator HydG
MRLKSLKSKLLVTVFTLVIGSGLLISLLVTQRYSSSLFQSMTAQAENLAHAVSLEAADKILINDLVSLQKTLDHHIRSNPAISYLFIYRDGSVLAHTFDKGIPADLVAANAPRSGDQSRFQEIASTGGEQYLDIAWPIFSGKAGVLRLGLSEKPYRRQVIQLWIQMSALSFGILLIAIVVSLLFIKRITGPLVELAKATEKIDEGHLELNVDLKGHDEVEKLTSSFNKMLGRIKEYTYRLEESTQQIEQKNLELDRTHRQLKTSFAISQEIAALPNLKDVCTYLIKKFKSVVACKHMVIFIFSSNREDLFVLSEQETRTLDQDFFELTFSALQELETITFAEKDIFHPTLLPDEFQSAKRLAILPLHHESELRGAMLIACPENCQCVTKELDIIELIMQQTSGAIKRAAIQEEEISNLRHRIEQTAEFSGLIGKDPKMQLIYKLIEDVAPTDATVLIQGESGTGKELVARAIHAQSLRKDNPFVVINCSAYPVTLLESELFGHEKGAFTGAMRQKSGRFEQAHGGTVFLDEIGEIPPSAQIKLLRVLQSRKFERLGSEQTLTVNIRILAATNKDLLQEVKNGQFREDLFYRLNVIPINLPPLRKRLNDIPLLAKHFLRRFSKEQDNTIEGFSSETMRLLLDYPWPGNVRELENTIEHATVLAKGKQVEVTDLPPMLRHAGFEVTANGTERTILENEKKLLLDVLEECGWNKKEAALRLGISRSALYSKLKRYNIAKPTVH